ncbi:nuclear receptor coactivator 7-like isoform X2 [Kryptolebias marmoratus]|uniref:nuclear receptor coactivator 7-like isoform X2 n=1 Tax=Kryptolebias marmoratus TaxID=37003 RepID=UPI0007F876F1|nr:nuclear receptor coactivator 7-like isoform X2 [Kryptolebias marmoratus]
MWSNFHPVKVKITLWYISRGWCLSRADMWHSRAQNLTEKSGALKNMKEHIRVFYFAKDCKEPYVEIITVKESKRRLSFCSSVESEAEENEYEERDEDFPVLSDQSQLLNEYQLQKLAAHMPARTQGYPWNLVYSTSIHGSSLKTLYRNMAGLDSPVLLVIKDMHKQVFGAFSSDPFRVSKYCYGTGETFLFSFNPDFQQYRWSGENSYFVSGNWESLQIGGGGGGFALWLDADLYHGASFSCPTFHNAPLSTHEDFIVQDVEVWTVQN